MKIKDLSKAIVLGTLFIVPALAIEVSDFGDENRAVKPISLSLYQEQRKFLREIAGLNGVGVNFSLVDAARNGQVAKVEMLLNRRLVKLHFTQFERFRFKRKLQLRRKSINSALVVSAENGHVGVVGLLLNLESLRPSAFKRFFYMRQLRPTQEGINLALVGAAGKGQAGVVRMLIDRSKGRLRPTKAGIVSAYHTAATRGKHSIVYILKLFVPTKEWREPLVMGDSREEFDDSIFMPCEFYEKPLIKNWPQDFNLHDTVLEAAGELITSGPCNKFHAATIA